MKNPMLATSMCRRRWLFALAVSVGIVGCASNMTAKSSVPVSSSHAPVNGIRKVLPLSSTVPLPVSVNGQFGIPGMLAVPVAVLV